MNTVSRHRRALIALGLGFTARAVFATDVPAALADNARAVVQAQLDAFAADDARRAFSLASPNARKQLGSPDALITLVRQSYPVVYRPVSVTFLKPELIDGLLVLGVQMTDKNGAAWLATYSLERQPDGFFLIGGCELVANEGRYT